MGRPIVSFEINPTSFNAVRYLENYVLTMPNRIHNIRINAVNAAARKMKTYLSNHYGKAGKGMLVKTGMKAGAISLRISPERAPSYTGGRVGIVDSQRWAANILFYGRRSYKMTRLEGKPYHLRQESRNKYGEYLRTAKIPSMPPNESAKSDIRQKASSLIREEIVREVAAQGFGPRGGNPHRMRDTSHISKSTAPSPNVRS